MFSGTVINYNEEAGKKMSATHSQLEETTASVHKVPGDSHACVRSDKLHKITPISCTLAGNHMVDFDEDQERYWLDQEEERQAGNLVWLQTTPEEAAAWAELRAEREIAALIRQEYAQALAEVARLQGE